MTGDVIEISPSPELEPQPLFRPLRHKHELLFLPDGNESVVELTDSTDSQSSTPCKRFKRRKEAVEPTAGSSTSLDVGTRSRVSSPRVIGRRAHKLKGQTPASRQASALPRRTTSPVPVLEQEQVVVQTKPLTPPATPDSPQLPGHQLTTTFDEYVPPAHDPPPLVTATTSAVVPETHERLVERVLEVVPDVLPSHVFDLLVLHENASANDLLGAVIHILLEDRSYPKDVKGKAKAKATGDRTMDTSGDINTGVDYTLLDANRHLGPMYRTLSLKHLHNSFPHLGHTYINETLALHDGHFVPAYLYLLQQGATPTSVTPAVPNLGKGKASSEYFLDEEEFAKEHAWLVQKLANHHSTPITDLTSQDMEEEGEDIECGCCFSGYPFSKMAQCTDTHLFCMSCVTSYASTKLGEQNSDLRCMDISGCKMSFPDSELRRVLPEKLFELYEHIRQRREIELAGLEGLEECPFCDYKVVMDVDFDVDKVLRCQNEVCEKVSCRRCKKEDHLPKSCEEVEEDKKLDGQHAIEEAMTRALMRNCPKCQKAFVKEYGCNKMTCTYCHTVSCYVCRSIIKGYDHFDQNRPGNPRQPGSSSKKCPLWDPVEDRHAKEVAAAADKALKEYKTLHPDVRDEDIRVALPPAPAPDMRMQHLPGRGGPRLPPPPAYVQVHHARNAHVPIAHPVMALPFPAIPAPPINPERLFAHGLPDFGDLGLGPLPKLDAPAGYPMPVPQPFNLLRTPPVAYNPLQALPPVPMHLPPPYPVPRMSPPAQLTASPRSRRTAGRSKRRR